MCLVCKVYLLQGLVFIVNQSILIFHTYDVNVLPIGNGIGCVLVSTDQSSNLLASVVCVDLCFIML